jgi:hypothetical protein
MLGITEKVIQAINQTESLREKIPIAIVVYDLKLSVFEWSPSLQKTRKDRPRRERESI